MRHESGLASLDQSIKPSGNTRQQVISGAGGDVDDNGGGDTGDDGGWLTVVMIDMPVKTLEQPCQSDCFRSAEREHQGEQCWSGDRETEPSVPGHR